MNNKVLVWLGGAALLITSIGVQADGSEVKLDTQKGKFSYAIGMQVAQGVMRDGLDVDTAALVQGMQDVLSGVKPKLSQEETQATFQAYQASLQKEKDALAGNNLKKGQAFLSENGKNEGVVTRKSGLQYQILRAGAGKQPVSTDTVVVHYSGTLIDGSEFDSSYRRGEPATFAVNAVVPGWQEVLPLMKQGSKWKVFIPTDLAYGERGAGASIGPNSTLIFEIELIEVK